MGAALTVALLAPASVGYIHFPPPTLPKLCKHSHHVRVLKVTKYDKERRVILFEVAEALKGGKSSITSFRHVLRADAAGAKRIVDWVRDGKTAVMFSIEAAGGGLGCGYVFIDGLCYSVDYNHTGQFWLLIRVEPGMSACYHGPVERLRVAVKDVLAGKEVTVPVKKPDAGENGDRRRKQVNDVLEKNRRARR
jgi:hypothetical protein